MTWLGPGLCSAIKYRVYCVALAQGSTIIKTRESGEPDYTYRLVESVRMGQAVRQQTVLNLGRQFEVPRAQ